MFLFFIAFSSQAQVELKNDVDSYLIGKSIFYLVDSTGELSFEEILAKDVDFTSSSDEQLNFGYTKNTTWVKLLVDNQSDFDDWILNLEIHFINYLDFYYQDGGIWKHDETGNYLNFDTKQISDIGFPFHLNTPVHSSKTYYLRCKSNSPTILPLYIQRYEEFSHRTRLKYLYYGAYFGILLIMIFYNLFIYITLKDSNYLYYVLTIITTLVVFSSVAGYSFMFLWPETPSLNISVTLIFMSFIVITTGIFTIKFLQLKKYSKILYYWMIVNIFLAVIAFPIYQLTSSNTAINSIISFHVITLILASIVVWRKGNLLGKYYFFAWFMYALGGGLITLRNSGVLPSNLITSHGAEVGSILEVLIISFALSEKYRLYKKENDVANKKALDIQEKANQELESKVNERTSELQATLEVVSEQNTAIEKKNSDIEKKNNNINSSINYASRIQEAFLAIDIGVKKYLPDYFIFFKPRDVVSGDFHFFAKKNDKLIIAVIDCTGHGVPGAMMAMIGDAYLSQIVHSSKEVEVDDILLQMHQKIRFALSQDDTSFSIQDGMDMAVCIIDKRKTILEFAGAKNPLIYIQDGILHQIKGSKFPIGGRKKEKDLRHYEKHTINISSKTTIYLASDGYQDQFGGEDNRKFMSKNFKNILLENYQKPLEEQKDILEETFKNWKGNEKQTDDVLVIGLRLDDEFFADSNQE